MDVSTEHYDMLVKKEIEVKKRIEDRVREIEIEVNERIEVKKIIEALVRKIEIEEKRIADDHDMLRKYRIEKKRIADDYAMLLKDLLEEKRVADAIVREKEIEEKRIADELRILLKNRDLPKQWWPTARRLLATPAFAGDLISFYEMWEDFLSIWRRYYMHLNPLEYEKYSKVIALTLLEGFNALINSRPAIALVA